MSLQFGHARGYTSGVMKALFAALVIVLGLSGALASQEPETSRAAQLYDRALNLMTGAAQNRDPVRAVDDLRESARLGYPPAQTAMIFYAVSQEEAFGYCKKAAEQGDALGQWCVGRAYFTGEGVQKDWLAAEVWLRKAAAQANPFAAYTMGLIQEERDPKTAPTWFQQAAEQGLPQAMRKLGLMLKDGRYLSVDRYRAYVWLQASAESGGAEVPEIGPLESDLGSTNVNKAKTEARELAQKTARAAIAHGCTGWEGEFGTPPSMPPLDVQRYCR